MRSCGETEVAICKRAQALGLICSDYIAVTSLLLWKLRSSLICIFIWHVLLSDSGLALNKARKGVTILLYDKRSLRSSWKIVVFWVAREELLDGRHYRCLIVHMHKLPGVLCGCFLWHTNLPIAPIVLNVSLGTQKLENNGNKWS